MKASVYMLNEIEVITANLRLRKARQAYNSAKRLLEYADYGAAIDRAFFCMHHAANAVNALLDRDCRDSCSVMSVFFHNYVADECIFDERYYKVMLAAQKSRSESNYSDHYIENKEDALRNVNNAGRLLEAMENFTARRVKYSYRHKEFDPDCDDEFELYGTNGA
jgi:uncharacterized protein (UPF0332 family)